MVGDCWFDDLIPGTCRHVKFLPGSNSPSLRVENVCVGKIGLQGRPWHSCHVWPKVRISQL